MVGLLLYRGCHRRIPKSLLSRVGPIDCNQAISACLPASRNYSSDKRKSSVAGAQKLSSNVAVHATNDSRWEMDFSNVQKAFKSKTTLELTRGAVVYQFCTMKMCVKYAMEIFYLAKTITGQRLFNNLMNFTFYGHFAAKESPSDIQNLTGHLREYGVGVCLAYSVEEEIRGDAHCHESHENNGDETIRTEHRARFERNLSATLCCIDLAGKSVSQGFVAVKLTAFGRPQLLFKYSSILTKRRKLFEALAATSYARGDAIELIQRKVSLNHFKHACNEMGIATVSKFEDIVAMFDRLDRDGDGAINVLDWEESLAEFEHVMCQFFVTITSDSGELVSLLPTLSESEVRELKTVVKRMDEMAHRAHHHHVRLLVDAEHTYLQPAINRIAMETMKKFNKNSVIVMNTYQSYLKKVRENLLTDLAHSKRDNFKFGVKLVRGAYMDHEREQAARLNYDDPVLPTYQHTFDNYHKNLSILLHEMKANDQVALVIASHNEDTVKFALKTMQELNLVSETHDIHFAQLLGMCDHITYTLGQAAHKVYKYVPYGPVQEVLPYLHRRAQENQSILDGRAELERAMYWQELRRRASRR